jgi:hypothetical protein
MRNGLTRTSSVLCVLAITLGFGLKDEARAQAWQRSRMEQGYYAAFITGA